MKERADNKEEETIAPLTAFIFVRIMDKTSPVHRRIIRLAIKGNLTIERPSSKDVTTLACFSTPGIFAEKGVTLKSYTPKAVTPTRAIFPFKISVLTFPSKRSKTEICGKVCSGP